MAPSSKRSKLRYLWALLLTAPSVHAQMPVRYVLADRVVVADPAPDRRFDPNLPAGGAFRSQFAQAFPGQVIQLSPDRMISPDERVIVILPRLTAVRTAHMVQAGSVHTFEAVVVGDISAIDPWTRTNLYSATRMVSGKVQLGESKLGDAEARIRDGFRDAYNRWIDVTVHELQQRLAPFVLDAATLAMPSPAGKSAGGIWPFGSARAVRVGATLTGADGRFARVTHAAQRFAVIEDVTDKTRQVQPGERYTLTVIDKPADRPEPRVALSWIGAPPRTPEGSEALDTDAMLGLFGDYISKSGALRILPPDLNSAAVRGEIQKLNEQVARYSKLASNAVLTLHAETLAQTAHENPERLLELGVIERYHGQRPGPNQSVEHYYRVTLAAAVYRRSGSDEAAQYPLYRVIQHSEELAQVTREGVREMDAADAWFSVTRNGVIRLAEQLLKELTPGSDETALRQGVVSADRSIQWNGATPGPGSPLEWLRPAGEVRTPAGELLGKFERLMPPSKGFLNARVLPQERLEAGDVLRYSATTALPVVGFGLEPAAPSPTWMPDPAWQLRLAGDALARAFDIRVLPLDQPAKPHVERNLILNLQALKAEPYADGALFTGQWRLRLMDALTGPDSPPLSKAGVQVDSRAGRAPNAVALTPPDISGWALKYLAESLAKLSDAATAKGVKVAIAAPRSEVVPSSPTPPGSGGHARLTLESTRPPSGGAPAGEIPKGEPR